MQPNRMDGISVISVDIGRNKQNKQNKNYYSKCGANKIIFISFQLALNMSFSGQKNLWIPHRER